MAITIAGGAHGDGEATDARPSGGACLPPGWLDGDASGPSPRAVKNLLRLLSSRPGVSGSCVLAYDGAGIRVALEAGRWRLDVGLRDDGGASLSGVARFDSRPCAPEDFTCVDEDFLARFDAYWEGGPRATDGDCPVGRDLRLHVAEMAREFASDGCLSGPPRVESPGFDAALRAALADPASVVDAPAFVAALREAATTRCFRTSRGAASLRLFAVPVSGPEPSEALADDGLFDGLVDSLKEMGVASRTSVLVVSRRLVSAERFAEATPGLVGSLVDSFRDAFRDAAVDGDVLAAPDGRLDDLFRCGPSTTPRRAGGPTQSLLVGVRVREVGVGVPDYLEAFGPTRDGDDAGSEWARAARAYLPVGATVGPPTGWNDAVLRTACGFVRGEAEYERRTAGLPPARAKAVHVAVAVGSPVYVAVEEEGAILGPYAVPSSMALCDLAGFESFLAATFGCQVLRVASYSDMPALVVRLS